ncbi:TetR/AcrR family transcriptional regulator [Actinoplanes sp. NPDC049265]|uniref:TetR/AcrR family transcriptional regulator n=1 Tax=Actinoplanes sp. NPDC049265 TaxID=3363902 RepID=UPI00371B7CE7
MSTTSDTSVGRRSGPETRAAIRQVALRLFTTQGYEATSMRQIAEILGIKKASLYYHFAGKEDIVRSLFDQRSSEAEQLLTWVSAQPRTAELVRTAVLRWVESFSADKLHGIRFLSANPLLLRTFAAQGGEQIGSALNTLAGTLVGLLPDATAVDALQLRMALLSINAAIEAAAAGDFTDEQILAAARNHADVLVSALLAGPRGVSRPRTPS